MPPPVDPAQTPVPDPGLAGFMQRLLRQFVAFFGVGVVAALLHYGMLYALVEVFFYDPVSASLAGYVAGGLVSYALNRMLTYQSSRSHLDAGWRFGVVAGVGFMLTWLLMKLFHSSWGWHYLLAQIVTTGIVLIWSFFAHKYWSFSDKS